MTKLTKTIFILLIFILLSCNNNESVKNVQAANNNIVLKHQINNSKHYTEKDTIYINTEIGEKLTFVKEEFNKIIDKHPEFFEKYPSNPDQLYFNDNDREEFGSEVGQDTYYALYAYFLKQRNGIDKYAKQRKKLIRLYSNINSLFGQIEYGGTYFGHQAMRILGYAEYSIYLLPKEKNDIQKTYNITEQKKLYIKSLRQLIEDESKINFNTFGKEKEERNINLNRIVNEIDMLITDIFYLRRAQEFQYGHYEYY